MKIKDLSPKLAYMRGYHRGRVTGRRLALEEAVKAIAEKAGWIQKDLRLSYLSDDELITLIQSL